MQHNDLEEEEETTTNSEGSTTDDDETKSGKNMEEASASENDSDEESEDEQVPEPLAPNRSRRTNAGNKMAELMNSAVADDFYESAYNGEFKEDDIDDNFTPVESDEDDDVDSDFDEEEETASNDDENGEMELKKEERQQKRSLLAKNKKWVVARFNKFNVSENACDPKTQKERLEEAKLTEKLNIDSLKRFEEFEIERKKRQNKSFQKVKPAGPLYTYVSKTEPELLTVLIVPEIKKFNKLEKREYRTCAVTGKLARYYDPLTELPYYDMEAFKRIRNSYKAFVESEAFSCDLNQDKMETD